MTIIAKIFKATQRLMIETFSQRGGRNIEMSKMPTPSLGKPILRAAQPLAKITQKAVAGKVVIIFVSVTDLAEFSAFWKEAALTILSICVKMQSALYFFPTTR